MNIFGHRSLAYLAAALFIFLFAGAAQAVSPALVKLSPPNQTITITAHCFAVDRKTPVACQVTLLDESERKLASKKTSQIANLQTVVFTVPARKSYFLLATPDSSQYARAISRRLSNLISPVTVNLTLPAK